MIPWFLCLLVTQALGLRVWEKRESNDNEATSITVGTTDDITVCTKNDALKYTCPTLALAVGITSTPGWDDSVTTGNKKITVPAKIYQSVGGSVTIADDLTIQGTEEARFYVVGDESQSSALFTLSASSDIVVTISNIIFELKSVSGNARTQSLFNVAKGTLNLVSVRITTPVLSASETPYGITADLITAAATATKLSLNDVTIGSRKGTTLGLTGKSAVVVASGVAFECIGCTFQNIMSTTVASAIVATLGATPSFKIAATESIPGTIPRKTSFTSCSSSGEGTAIAAIAITASDVTGWNDFSITGIEFRNCLDKDSKVRNIYIAGPNTLTGFPEHLITLGADTLSEDRDDAWRTYIVKSNSADYAFYELGKITVDASSADATTISGALASAKYTGKQSFRAVSLVATSLASESVSIGDNSVCIAPATACTITCEGVTLFTVSTGSLHVLSLGVTLNTATPDSSTANAESNTQLLSLTSTGYVNLTSVTVSNVASRTPVLTKSLIATQSGSLLDMYGCSFTGTKTKVALLNLGGKYNMYTKGSTKNTFDSIERTTGNGTILEITSGMNAYTATNQFKIQNMAITSCTASGTDNVGDAFYFAVDATRFEFTNVAFTPVSNRVNALVYFIAQNSYDDITTTDFTSLISSNSGTDANLAKHIVIEVPQETDPVSLDDLAATLFIENPESAVSSPDGSFGKPYTKFSSVSSSALSAATRFAVHGTTAADSTGITIAKDFSIVKYGDGSATVIVQTSSSTDYITITASGTTAYVVTVKSISFLYDDATSDNHVTATQRKSVFDVNDAFAILSLDSDSFGVVEDHNVELGAAAVTVTAGSLSVAKCTFTGLTASTTASAISATLGTTTTVSITGVESTNTFKDCISTDAAGYGPVYIDASSGTENTIHTQVVLTKVSFSGCGIQVDNSPFVPVDMYMKVAEGHLATITTNQADNTKKWVVTDNTDSNSAVSDNRYVLLDVDNSGTLKGVIPLKSLVETPASPYKVAPTGYDFAKCGASAPCKTFQYAVGLPTTSVSSISVDVTYSTTSYTSADAALDIVSSAAANKIMPNSDSVSIIGSAKTDEAGTYPVIDLSATAYSVDKSGLTLILKQLNFEITNAAAVLATLTTGSLVLDNIAVTQDNGVTSVSADLITMAATATALTVTSSTFTGIAMATGKNVIKAAVGSGMTLYLGCTSSTASTRTVGTTPVTFDSCSSSDAIVSIDATATTITGVLCSDVVIIDGNIASSTSTYIKYTIVAATQLAGFIGTVTSSSIVGKVSSTASAVASSIVYDRCSVVYSSAPVTGLTLKHLWLSPTEATVYVSTTGSDNSYTTGTNPNEVTTYTCGWDKTPCKTVAIAYAACSACTAIELDKKTDYTQETGDGKQHLEVTIAKAITIYGKDTTEGTLNTAVASTLKKSCFTVSGSSITASDIVSIKGITLNLGADNVVLLTSSVAGTVELNTIQVSLAAAQSLSAAFISITAGGIKLSTVSIGTSGKTLTVAGHPLIELDTTNKPNIEIISSTFTNITRGTSGAGSVLVANVAQNGIFKISGTASAHTTFDTCVDTGTGGGPVVVTFDNAETFGDNVDISFVTFTTCTSGSSAPTNMHITVNDANTLRNTPKWLVVASSGTTPDDDSLELCNLAFTSDSLTGTTLTSPSHLKALWTGINRITALSIGSVSGEGNCNENTAETAGKDVCKTVPDALNLIKQRGWATTATTTIGITGTVEASKLNTTSSTTFSIAGSTTPATSVASGALFTLSGAADFTLDTLSVTMTGGQLLTSSSSGTITIKTVTAQVTTDTSFSVPLIVATKGTLSLSGIVVGVASTYTMTYSQCSTIKLSKGVNFECTGSTFQRLAVTNGEGILSAVISTQMQAADPESEPAVTANYFYMSDYPKGSTTQGTGNTFSTITIASVGAVYVDMTETGVLPTSVTIAGTTFTECQTTDSTPVVKSVSILCTNSQLDSIKSNQGVTASKWIVQKDNGGTAADDYDHGLINVADKSDTEITFSTLVEILSNGEYAVAITGIDFGQCGNTKGCETVAYAAKKDANNNKVTVKPAYSATAYPLNAMSLQTSTVTTASLAGITVEGVKGGTNSLELPFVALSGLAYTVDKADLPLEVKDLKFLVVEAKNDNTHLSQLAIVTASTLTLTSVEVEQPSTLPEGVSSSDYQVVSAITNALISVPTEPLGANEPANTVKYAQGSLEIKDCSFSKITSGANGAVITAGKLSTTSTFKIEGTNDGSTPPTYSAYTSFVTCTSAANGGGAIYVDVTAVTTWTQISFAGIKFTGCKAGTTDRNMYIIGTGKLAGLATLQPTSVILDGTTPAPTTDLSTTLCIVAYGTTPTLSSLSDLWTAIAADVASVTIAQDGVDTQYNTGTKDNGGNDIYAKTCGSTTNPCSSVTNAIPVADTATTVTATATYSETAYGDGKLTFDTSTISGGITTLNIVGTKSESTLLEATMTSNNYNLNKATVTLQLQDIKYKLTATTSKFATTTAGVLHLTGVNIYTTVTSAFSNPIIDIATGVSFAASGSTFSGFTVSGGTGDVNAVITAVVPATSTVTFSLTSSTFTNCKSTISGAVYLDITAAALTQVTLTGNKFSGCQETTTNTARDMYLVAVSTQSEGITNQQGQSSKWTALTAAGADDTANVVVILSDASPAVSVPLSAFTDTIGTTGNIHTSGQDHTLCGVNAPCQTVSSYITAKKAVENALTVNILASSSLYTTTQLTAKLVAAETAGSIDVATTSITIQGEATTILDETVYPNIELTTSCYTINAASLTLTVKQLNFYVNNANAQLVTVTDGTVALHTITVTQYPSSATDAPSGISAINSIGQSLISLPTSSVTVEGSTSTVGLGSLTITSCAFTGITTTATDKPGIVVSGTVGASKQFKITGTTFTSCKDASTNSDGGAIAVDISAVSTFANYVAMDYVKFVSCQSNSQAQNMYVSLGDFTSDRIAAIIGTTWNFVEPTLESSRGKYAMTYNQIGVDANNDPTSTAVTSNVFNDLVGPVSIAHVDLATATDPNLCGGSLNPCHTVQSAAANQPSVVQTIEVDYKASPAFASVQLDTTSVALKHDLVLLFKNNEVEDETSHIITYTKPSVSVTGTLFTWTVNKKLTVYNLDVTIGSGAQIASVSSGELVIIGMSVSQSVSDESDIIDAIYRLETLPYTNGLEHSLIQMGDETSITLDDTVSFKSICSNMDGGVLHITYNTKTQVIDIDAKFDGCKTKEMGAIMYIELGAAPDEVNGYITLGSRSAPTGTYIATKGGNVVALEVASSLTAADIANPLANLIPFGRVPGDCVYSNATDLGEVAYIASVKNADNNFKRLADAIADLEKSEYFNLGSISVEDDGEIGTTILTKSLKITGSKKLEMTSGGTIFTISYAYIGLHVESLTINLNSTADKFSASLLYMEANGNATFKRITYDGSAATKAELPATIAAKAGVVTLRGCTFSNLKETASFFSITETGKLYSLVSGTTRNTFDTISSTGVNGTIFKLSHPTVVLENMEFKSCSAAETSPAGTDKTGYGGIAYIDASSATTFEFINIAITAGSSVEGSVFFINVGSADTNIKYSDFIDLIAANNLTDDSIKYWNNTDKGAVTKISGRIETAELKVDSTKSFMETLTASDSKFTTDSATAVTIPSGTFKESADAITLDRSVTISGASASDTTIPFTGKDTAFKISGGKAGKIVTVVLKSITLSYYGSTSSRSNDAAQVGSMVSVAQYTTAELNSITIKPDDNHNNIILTSSCITSEGNLILTDMTIQDLTLQDKSLIYIKDITKDTFKLTNTNTFTNIVKKEGDGAILSVTLAATSELVITNVTFDSCEASNGNGGVLSITQNGGKLTLKSVTFNNCNAKTTTSTYTSTLRTNAEGDTSSDNTPSTPTSNEKYDTGCGGCLYVSHSADGTHDMSDLTIKGGSASGFGSVLFITGSISSAILKQYKTLLLQAQGSKQCMYFGADKQTQALDLSNLVPSTIYVDAEGTKTETCEKSSESTKACDLLSSAIQSYYGLGKGIQIAAGTYVDTAVYGLPLNRQMSIVGESGTIINITASRTSDDVRSVYIVNPSSDATISFESITFNVITPSSSVGSVFSLTSTATLALAYVQLIGDGGLMEDSVIRANAGKVDLTGCTIKSFETYSDALIYSYRPTITLNAGNTFDSISRRSGNGAVFEFEMTKGDSFTLIGSKFSKCASKDGRGGAIYIAYDGGDLVIGDEKETKKDEITTIFEGCSAGSSSASTTRVNSLVSNDDAGKTSEDFEDNLPTSGAGGALYVDIYDIDTNTYNFNITSVKFTDCTATKEGNAVYLRAHTEAGTTMLKDKAFWKTMLKMNKASGDFVYADYTNKSKTAPKSPNLLGLWLGLGLGLGLLAIAGVVITIVCCMRKKKISPSEEKKSTEMSPV